MFHESLSQGNSFLRKCDPRVKIMAALYFTIVIATTREPNTLVMGAFFVFFCFALMKGKFIILFKRLLAANIFIFILALTLPITTPGSTVYTIGTIQISREGLFLGSLVFVKSNLIILLTLLLLSTSPIISLTHAMHHLHVPTKLVNLLFFTFRYLHTIHLEYQKLLASIKLRCFQPKTNLYTYRTMAYLAANLIIKSYDRSERVYQAMLCRGFTGIFPTFYHFHLSGKDILFSLFSGIYLTFMAISSFFEF